MKFALAAGAAILFVAGAQAASIPVIGLAPISDNYIQKQMTLEYAEVAPGDKAAATALFARIQEAAQTVCSTARQSQSVAMNQRVANCRSHAVADAVARVGSPDVAAAAH